jgi:iron complex transport system permease protein
MESGYQLEAGINRELSLYRLRVRKGIVSLFIAAAVLAMIIVISGAIGSSHIPPQAIIDMLINRAAPYVYTISWPASMQTIFFDIRMPRIIMAGLVGSALSVAGAAYQGMFRNPLADPYLTGVSQGAALGAVIGFLLPFGISPAVIPVLAFIGAVLSVTAVYLIARVGRTVPMTTLILGGVAMGAFLASVTSYMLIISGDKMHGIVFWLLGTFSLADWWRVSTMAPYILGGIIIICLMARPLNVMQMDEDQAQQLGINVERIKLFLLVAATLATAAAVCFCGIIGFVGIIIPHTVRILTGPDYRFLLPLSALTGAGLLIVTDTLSRTLLAPSEVPVGIITALIGAPFFLYLLTQKKRALF